MLKGRYIRRKREKWWRKNYRITAKEVRLIGKEGEPLGIVGREEALRRAREAMLDLVEIVPQANPPVCRIIDYNKYRYEQKRREKEIKKKQRSSEQKEIRLSPLISEHDYQFKKEHIENFLKEGSRVKVTLRFKGRQIVHPEKGREVLEKLAKDLTGIGEAERNPRFQGRFLDVIFKPVVH